MGVKRILKKGVTSGWSIKRWVGIDSLKNDTHTLSHIAKGVLRLRRNKQKGDPADTSFESVMKHYGLTEEDLKTRMNNAKAIVIFCLLSTVIVFGYFLYILFFHHQYLSAFVCLTLMFLLLAYAFREHFNLFQMRQRRLGCTIQEWFNATFRKGNVNE